MGIPRTAPAWWWSPSPSRNCGPAIPAHEFSGVITAVGTESALKVGDQVIGLVPFDRDGAAAEFVAVPDANVVRKPRRLDHKAAATIPLAALTAWQALVNTAFVGADDHVLVHGGTGGAGLYVVQLAAWLGATVTVTAHSEDAAFLTELGAARVIDDSGLSFEEQVVNVDVVIDLVGAETFDRSLAVMRTGGVRVALAEHRPPGGSERADVTTKYLTVQPNTTQLMRLAQLADEQRLRPVVGASYPLAEAPAAYRALEDGRVRGTLVIEVQQAA